VLRHFRKRMKHLGAARRVVLLTSAPSGHIFLLCTLCESYTVRVMEARPVLVYIRIGISQVVPSSRFHSCACYMSLPPELRGSMPLTCISLYMALNNNFGERHCTECFTMAAFHQVLLNNFLDSCWQDIQILWFSLL